MPRSPQMPERQLLLLTAQCLAAQRDWPALQHMAGRQDRRAGLGMDQFIAAARWGPGQYTLYVAVRGPTPSRCPPLAMPVGAKRQRLAVARRYRVAAGTPAGRTL